MAMKLFQVGGQLYSIDVDALHRKMFEPMPMIIGPPPPPTPRIFMRTAHDFGPVLRVPNSVIMSSMADIEDYQREEWEFVYLFPLGKRGYKRNRPTSAE